MSSSIVFTVFGITWFFFGFAAAVFPWRYNALKNKRKRRFIIVPRKFFQKFPLPLQVALTSFSGALLALIGVYVSVRFPIEIAVPYSRDHLFASQSADFSPSAHGAESKETIDPIVLSFFRENNPVGMVVGVVTPKETGIFGYGTTALRSGSTPDAGAVYEIGSITKTFTGILLADQVENGSFELDSPVESLLPGKASIPSSSDGRRITLLDLATHASGLPRLPLNIFSLKNVLTLDAFRDPYRNYKVDDLYAFLASHELESAPGSPSGYSNLGVGLLGHVLEQQAGKTYGELVFDRVCRPLGMKETKVNLDPGMEARLAKPYGSYLGGVGICLAFPAENWDIGIFAGAGALKSTGADMLKYLKASMAPEETPIAKAIKLSQTEHLKVNEGLSLGLGWHIFRREEVDGRIFFHNGGTGGYRSYLAFLEQAQVGVFVLSNTSYSVDDLGFELLYALAG